MVERKPPTADKAPGRDRDEDRRNGRAREERSQSRPQRLEQPRRDEGERRSRADEDQEGKPGGEFASAGKDRELEGEGGFVGEEVRPDGRSGTDGKPRQLGPGGRELLGQLLGHGALRSTKVQNLACNVALSGVSATTRP